MRTFIPKTARAARNEEGFVLVLALVTLLLLTLFGVWALNTSDFENRVAGNAQQADRGFNLNEGANYAEASKVVHLRRTWIDPGNIYKVDFPLLPPQGGDNDFDPFRSTNNARTGRTFPNGVKIPTLNDAYGDGVKDGSDPEILKTAEYWAWDNLEYEYGTKPDHQSDYRYMLSYQKCDNIAPLGWDSGSGDSGTYQWHTNLYRIQAVGAGQRGVAAGPVVESAVQVVGPGGCN